MKHHPLTLHLESDAHFDVRTYEVREETSTPFAIRLTAVASSSDVDFEAIVGHAASLELDLPRYARRWAGLCSDLRLIGYPESSDGLATYALTLVPRLWLLGQRRNHRMFQQLSEPEIVVQLFEEWNIAHRVQLERTYPRRKVRVQYGETDLDFARRMLEAAGITFTFVEENGEPVVVLDDTPTRAAARDEPLACRVTPPEEPVDFATQVQLGQQIRTGRYTVRDHDYRLPSDHDLSASFAEPAAPMEESLEAYHYEPGAFLYGAEEGQPTPTADDRGKTRSRSDEAEALVERRLHAERGDYKTLTFETSAYDVRPGTVVTFIDHPHRELREGERWLVVGATLRGTWTSDTSLHVEARSANHPFRPPLVTPRPKVMGVESATVVGPEGEEIHTDEFGRVRVHFHWDRYDQRNQGSSVWIHVVQSWSGAGYGGIQIPRIGQEVIVDFLGGDPDRPVITGRVYTNLQRVPYRLPEHKTRSTWKSQSSPDREGFNELMFEDLAGQELVWQQAEKNQRRLVKNDEVITVGNDRQKLVKGHEQDTTYGNRFEHTHGDRSSLLESNQFREVGIHDVRLVHGDRVALTRGNRRVTVNQDDDEVYLAERRTRVTGSNHVQVDADHREKVGATRSLQVVESDQVRVGRDHALEAGRQIHLRAGDQVVMEAGVRLTIKGPGGFIDIHSGGIDVVGQLVRINSGGGAGEGAGASPAEPEAAKLAEPEPLEQPPVDDVSETGIGQ